MTTTAKKTFYDVLGVPRDATPEAIRKAYLKLAHQFHPDKTGGDKSGEEKLKEVNEAYHTLKNVEKRKEYDAQLQAEAMFGRHAQASGPGDDIFRGGFNGFDMGGGGDSSPHFNDFIDELFRRGSSRRAPSVRPGPDLEARLQVTLREAIEGAKKNILLTREEICDVCHGSRAKPGTSPSTCPDCQGKGVVRQSEGTIRFEQTCRRCGGIGQIVTEPCATCLGSGHVTRQRELSISIPAGVDTGARLRLAGEGGAGTPGQPSGDLFVFIEVLPDRDFTREGADIVHDVSIPFTLATLGGKIRVRTLKGQADLNVPPGVQNGEMLRMRGLGVPAISGGRPGDQLVRIRVTVPKKLTPEQRRLIEQLREIE